MYVNTVIIQRGLSNHHTSLPTKVCPQMSVYKCLSTLSGIIVTVSVSCHKSDLNHYRCDVHKQVWYPKSNVMSKTNVVLWIKQIASFKRHMSHWDFLTKCMCRMTEWECQYIEDIIWEDASWLDLIRRETIIQI